MAQLPILEYPDDTLRQASLPVTAFDDALRTLVDDLFDTMHATGAIGLSAPQAGDLQQVLVIHVPGDEYGAQAYINPELIWSARPGFVQESCLSVPGVEGNVLRATQARVAASDVNGKRFEREISGMHAVCLQHEMDHLEGTLFIDRLSWFRRLRLRRAEAKSRRKSADREGSLVDAR